MTNPILLTEDPSIVVVNGHDVLHNVHSVSQCAGRPCTIHNPTNHEYHDQPMWWDDAAILFFRICPHGISVLDPDQLDYLDSIGKETVDLCCGKDIKTGPWVECSVCYDMIRSVHRHDFVRCDCGETFVDGGSDYTRMGGKAVFA